MKKLKDQPLVLITIGNPLRGDDGVASAVCDLLPKEINDYIRRFDLQLFTAFLPDCLNEVSAAIIVDAIRNGKRPGSTTIIDLIPLLIQVKQASGESTGQDKSTTLSLPSCHNISFMDELRFLGRENKLPARLIFFGIEIQEALWQAELSNEVKLALPTACNELNKLIQDLIQY